MTAGLDADQAGLQACEEWRNPITLELLAKNGDAAFVDAVHSDRIDNMHILYDTHPLRERVGDKYAPGPE